MHVAHVAQADGAAYSVAIAAARQITDEFAVAQDGLAAAEHHIAVLGGEAAEPFAQRLAGSLLQRLAPDEGRAPPELDKAAEAGFEGRVVGRDVAAPGAVELLESERLDGAIAGELEPVGASCGHDGIEQLGCGVGWHV